MRPIEHLPVKFPWEEDPEPKFFYDNFVKYFIPDMIKMMNTGICIDDKAVENLRTVIDEVQFSVHKKLENNSGIKKLQEYILPAAKKAHKEKSTQSVRTTEHYLKTFNSKDILHRTWVVNTYLKSIGKSKDCKEKWQVNELTKYNVFLKSKFIAAIIEKRSITENDNVIAGMEALAAYKTYLWNKPRYDKAKEEVILDSFNPNSDKQVKELFEMYKLESSSFSEKTGEPSWGREQIEEIRQYNSDPVLEEILESLVDNSYSAIIKNNFIKAFDTYTVDGILHGNISLFGAKTFRNTSNSPNLLNAPSSKSIYAAPLKRCFVAGDGFVVFTADLGALEDRVISNLSGDKNKQNIFLEGLDGHSLNACGYYPEQIAKIMGENTDNVAYVKEFYRRVEDERDKELKKIRFNSKAPTFKLAYGGFPDSHKGGVITQEIFDNYNNILYPGITKYREEYVLPTALKQGYLHLGLGCRIYCDNPNSQIRTLHNATIQFWSILTLIAINELNYRIQNQNLEKEIQITSSIYDSIYTRCRKDPEIVKWVNDNLIELMTVQYIENEVVHNTAQGEVGLNWADLNKVPNNASVEEIAEILSKL